MTLQKLLPLSSLSHADSLSKDIRPSIDEVATTLSNIDHIVTSVRDYIQQEQSELSRLRKLQIRLEQVTNQMNAINDQMPAELHTILNENQAAQLSSSPPNTGSENTPGEAKGAAKAWKKPSKKASEKSSSKANNKTKMAKSQSTKSKPSGTKTVESKTDKEGTDVPQIREVAQEELDLAPQYVRGRLTVEKITTVVEKLNEILEKKYSLLSKPFRDLNSREISQYETLREAFCPEVHGKVFVTDVEIKGFGSYRMDAMVKSVINILRHVCAVKEIRGENRSRIFIIN